MMTPQPIGKTDRFMLLPRVFRWPGVVFICFLALIGSVRADERPVFYASEIRIQTAQGRHSFSIEVAASESARVLGLQGRRYLAPDTGMLFDFERSRRLTMWMKNTFIPLDMIFIDAKGYIVHIAEWTVPFSLETISAPVPARAVLEVKGGTAARLGIVPGDRVEHAIFK
jgi:hypothetical protein